MAASLWRLSLVTVFLFLFSVNLIWGQEVLDELKAQVPAGLIPENLQNLTFPVDKVIDGIKDKCSKVSGSDAAFEEAQQGQTKVVECLSGLLNWTEMQEEIEKAKPTGDLETVFNKYCKRRHTAIECVSNFTQSVGGCLTEKENKDKQIVVDIVTHLLGFVCHKEGDQIALFIAEKGPECFTEQKDAMIGCMNSTFGEYMPEGGIPDNLPQEVPNFTFGDKQCESMDELKECVVAVLSKCQETTPANLVESAFKFVRNETPCKNVTTKYQAAKRSNAISLRTTLSTVLGSTSFAFLLSTLL